ncbi:MAG: hypothetical protein ACRDQU_20775 [Pseudonocardiaceae bacterium]
MSRGHGKVERFVLDRLNDAASDGQWPAWATVEVLTGWYVGLDRGEVVMTRDDDGHWRGSSHWTSTDPTAHEHLIGLSVEYRSDPVCAQRLSRSAVESVRRATKNLAAQGHIAAEWIDVPDRGRVYAWRHDGHVFLTRGSVAMFVCRRLLTDTEAAIEARRAEPWMASARAAMAMLKAMR